MSYRSRRADLASEDDVDHLRDLHVLTFGDIPSWIPDFTEGAWWLVYSTDSPDPVAFAGMIPCPEEGTGAAYHKRAGVLREHLGHGLQRRLIAIRERWARKQGYTLAVTETYDNPPSANNFIRCGYVTYEPKTPWGYKGALYFKKKL